MRGRQVVDRRVILVEGAAVGLRLAVVQEGILGFVFLVRVLEDGSIQDVTDGELKRTDMAADVLHRVAAIVVVATGATTSLVALICHRKERYASQRNVDLTP